MQSMLLLPGSHRSVREYGLKYAQALLITLCVVSSPRSSAMGILPGSTSQ